MTEPLEQGVLVALRFASADLEPYRDSTRSLPPGWPRWRGPINELADFVEADRLGLLHYDVQFPILLTQGRAALREQGYPEHTSFDEFWTWFCAQYEANVYKRAQADLDRLRKMAWGRRL